MVSVRVRGAIRSIGGEWAAGSRCSEEGTGGGEAAAGAPPLEEREESCRRRGDTEDDERECACGNRWNLEGYTARVRRCVSFDQAKNRSVRPKTSQTCFSKTSAEIFSASIRNC